ncbi:MAG: hypothetical protein LBT11_07635 [Treponema sp.]|jgi:hypothetical protein|nr:hypothetical protein [Treponema sp.]
MTRLFRQILFLILMTALGTVLLAGCFWGPSQTIVIRDREGYEAARIIIYDEGGRKKTDDFFHSAVGSKSFSQEPGKYRLVVYDSWGYCYETGFYLLEEGQRLAFSLSADGLASPLGDIILGIPKMVGIKIENSSDIYQIDEIRIAGNAGGSSPIWYDRSSLGVNARTYLVEPGTYYIRLFDNKNHLFVSDPVSLAAGQNQWLFTHTDTRLEYRDQTAAVNRSIRAGNTAELEIRNTSAARRIRSVYLYNLRGSAYNPEFYVSGINIGPGTNRTFLITSSPQNGQNVQYDVEIYDYSSGHFTLRSISIPAGILRTYSYNGFSFQ